MSTVYVAEMSCPFCNLTQAYITDKPSWFARFMVAWRLVSHLDREHNG